MRAPRRARRDHGPPGQLQTEIQQLLTFMKPSLPRLQILTGLLARPQEPPCQSGRKLAEYLASDIGTADEFLARYGWRVRYAKARWLIYCDGRWRIDGDNVSIVELFEEFRASILKEANQVADTRLQRRARRRVAHLGSLPMLNRILRLANARAAAAIPEGLHYASSPH